MKRAAKGRYTCRFQCQLRRLQRLCHRACVRVCVCVCAAREPRHRPEPVQDTQVAPRRDRDPSWPLAARDTVISQLAAPAAASSPDMPAALDALDS